MSMQPALPLPAPGVPTPTRVAPHNLEAEQALLGAILFDNETYNRITPLLQPKHFYDPVHGRIFAACSELIAAGDLADGVTLKERFARDGGIREIGGAVYLMKLMDAAAPLSAQAQSYAELIYDLALRRELIRVGNLISDLAENPPDGSDAKDIIEESERTLFSLAENGSANSGFSPFSRALTASVNSAAAAYESDTDVSGLATQFEDLDRMLGGLHGSDLIILAGRPSMGKTALALNMAFNIARQRLNHDRAPEDAKPNDKGGVVAFFSLEMSAEQLATRLLSDAAGIESDRIRRGKIQKHEFERLQDAAADLQALPLHIDETGAIGIAQLQARARRLKRTSGLDCIVVDYLQLVTGSKKGNDGRVQEVSEITQGLKALAKDLQVPLIALSQLSRQVENRDDKRPQLSDLRESGSIEQDADAVMFVYRESYYLERAEPREGTPEHIEWMRQVDEVRNQAEVIIGKQRHGPIGKVKLFFDSRYTRFGNLSSRSIMTDTPPRPRLARLRVDHAAIVENWRFFKKLAPSAAVAAVVKADSYGLGCVGASRALAQAGARVFFTATAPEALIVRRALGEGPQIFVLNGPSGDELPSFAQAKLTPVLNSLAQIKLWGGRGPAALHVDTGMNRLGIGPEELAPAATALKDATLALIMSHLACASDPKHEMNGVQLKRFVDAATLFPKAPLSLAASSGALLGADYHFDLVRPGIGLYGSAGLDADNPPLNAAAVIEAPILQVRDVEPGETFGYGATASAPKRMRAATVALGYADGYLRSLGGRGYGVLAGGRRAVLGRISMDLTILDVTGCAEAAPGAMVEFLGPNAPLDEVAALAGTSSYEILTTLAGTVRKTGARA